MYKSLIFVLAAAWAPMTTVAASTVTVVVMNESPEDVALWKVSKNEHSTSSHAAPLLQDVVRSQSSTRFHVAPYITQDVNFAAVRYRSQTRQCAFLTSYVNTYTRGMRIPKWNHSATGKAGCTSRIVRTDPVSHDWTVEFRIR